MTILGSGSFQQQTGDSNRQCHTLNRPPEKSVTNPAGGSVNYNLPPPAAYNQGYSPSPSNSPIYNPTGSLRRHHHHLLRDPNLYNKQGGFNTNPSAQYDMIASEKAASGGPFLPGELGCGRGTGYSENSEGWVNPLLRYNQQTPSHHLDDPHIPIKHSSGVSGVDLVPHTTTNILRRPSDSGSLKRQVRDSSRIPDTGSLKRQPRDPGKGVTTKHDIKESISTIASESSV